MYQVPFTEKSIKTLARLVKENLLPLLSSLVAGLAAYLYCFTNKLEIMDDLACMFYHGDSISSGRWGLELTTRFFPAYSMPWLNGLLSILLISIGICVILRMTGIRSCVMKLLLPAVIIAFPSQMCTFAYMFAAPHYALAFLLAVLSAWCLSKAFTEKDGKPGIIRSYAAGGILLLVFSMSIYQAYLSVAASLLIVFAFSLTLSEGNRAQAILKKGLSYIVSIVIGIVLYYAVTAIVKKLTGTEFNRYASDNFNGLKEALFGLRVAYTAFLGYFYRGYYDLILPGASRSANILLVILAAAFAVRFFIRKRGTEENRGRMLTALLCVALLPLGVNCLRVISTTFHNLMLFGFISVYVLEAVIFENCLTLPEEKHTAPVRDLAAICLLVIAAVNINFANSVYLKMDIQFKQAQSFYTGIVTRLSEEPGFDENSLICIVGDNDGLYPVPNVDVDDLSGIREGVVGVYSQRAFVRFFVGYDLKIADTDITDILEDDARVIEMPQYPYYGSVKNIDGAYVIKVGPCPAEQEG